jgi:hypothetical protein
MAEILCYRRSNGDEVKALEGSALHERISQDGEYVRITELGGDVYVEEDVEEDAETEEEENGETTEDLPIEGYDDLNVEEIVGHLEDLDDEELSIVEAFEIANKNRKGVLDAIEAVRSE